MGFFSWNCNGCGKSITADTGGLKDDAPFNPSECVALLPNGTIISGTYDGYGRIDDFEIVNYDGEVELWHRHCWEEAGKPSYSKPSSYANDQGFFLNKEEWDEFYNFE